MAPKAPRILPGAAALGLVLAACGGRVALDVPDCSGDAVAYCKTDGCPLTGPAASTPTGVSVWCTGSTAFAPRVTGYGTCTTPAGQVWATDVRATDATGAELFVLYDPASGQLLSVSTVASGDAGAEHDYGTCGAHSGIVTCTTVAFTCAR
jgi:hypothetical protein